MPVQSVEQALARPCSDFDLPSVDGKRYSLQSFKDSKALLVAFICNHCPYVKAIEDRILALARSYSANQLQIVAICSNDWAAYPEDAPEYLLERWNDKKYGFPYLIDESQKVAQAFGAVCTPDLFLFDQNRKLFYHGRLDDSWKDPTKVTKQELREAIDELLADRPAPRLQNVCIGCSIKWRA